MSTRDEYFESMLKKVKFLNENTWEHRVNLETINPWLDQFQVGQNQDDDEQLHVLYLLTNFIYFGQMEIRGILKSLYRDLYKTPTIHEIRRNNGDSRDENLLKLLFKESLDRTKFLGVGNPSESGSHLLYYFRQENNLPKTSFINSHEIFQRENTAGVLSITIRDKKIENYIFIDDLCGSGTQAEQYSVDLVTPLKQQSTAVRVWYLVMFATSAGLKAVRDLKIFDKVEAVFELDETFKVLEPNSRLFSPAPLRHNREAVRRTCEKYGAILWPAHPLGYKDGQLVIGFSHNTPDNTLPIFWADLRADGSPWAHVFRRYAKIYG